MGTPDGDQPPDHDHRPDEPLDLPELPALPAGVVIPDDISALADEAARVREELTHPPEDVVPPEEVGLPGDVAAPEDVDERWEAPRPWGAPPAGATGRAPPGVPLVVMGIAVVITLVSLFALAWAGSTAREAPPPAGTQPLPEVILTDEAGRAASVSSFSPMVIILVERCDCGDLVADTTAATPAGVTVVVVDETATPDGIAAGSGTRFLADPDGLLRDRLQLGAAPTDAATVVLVDRQGEVVLAHPAASSPAPYQHILPTLGR